MLYPQWDPDADVTGSRHSATNMSLLHYNTNTCEASRAISLQVSANTIQYYNTIVTLQYSYPSTVDV